MTAKPVKITFLADESDLAKSLNSAGGDLDQFAGDAKAAGAKAETAFSGVGDKADALGSATSQAAGGLGDLGGALSSVPGPLGALGAGMESAAPAIMGVTGAADLLNLATTKFPALAKAQAVATEGVAIAQRGLNAVMAGNPIALVVLAIVALIAIFAVAYAKSETFRNIVNGAFGAVKRTAEDVVGFFTDKIPAAFDTVKTAAGNALGWVRNNWPTILAVLTGPIGLAALAIHNHWEDIKNGVTGVKTWIVDKFNDLVTFFQNAPARITTAAAGLWDGIKSEFKGVVNSIIGWWNELSFSVDIPDKIPGLPDSFTISTPNIPMLANGGIVTRPTLAVIGEAGPEAVVPLSRYNSGGGAGDNVRIEVVVPPGADLVSIGAACVQAVDAYYRAGGRSAYLAVSR